MGLNYNVWLPHLKFTLQTIAMTYPSKPNDVSKRKYYDLIQNLPLFFDSLIYICILSIRNQRGIKPCNRSINFGLR